MQWSRRDIFRLGTSAGILISVSRLVPEPKVAAAVPTLFGQGQYSETRVASLGGGRVEGAAKVTGSKIYVSDFRASDMPGWPTETAHALLLRSPEVGRVFEGLSLVGLIQQARPSMVVTADEILAAGLETPSFYAGELLCPAGTAPRYLGQPVALLLFETFDAYDIARRTLREETCLRFGAAAKPEQRANYVNLRFVRVAGPDALDTYSPFQEGWINPPVDEKSGRPLWEPQRGAAPSPYEVGEKHGERIRAELSTPSPDLLVLDRSFTTQSVDPMFLEPECGLAWYDPGRKRLELLLGVQSPHEAASSVGRLLEKAAPAFRPDYVDAKYAYLGGGFGGRDHTPFPLYVAIAAMFLPGKPIRLAHDRQQQFQGGLKRHAAKMRSQMAIDRASGKIMAFAGDHVLDGGGLANYSASVAAVGATAAIGIYDIPKVDVTTVAECTRGVPAGSMRGYGTLQTMTALETLIDEAAFQLEMNPIEFRRRNLLPPGGRSMTGNPWTVSVRTAEILDKLEMHPIWRDRASAKSEKPDTLVGTGTACCTKSYGTGADCSHGRVEIAPDGTLTVSIDSVEMGNGIATAAAHRVGAILGFDAGSIATAQTSSFSELELVTFGDPYTITQHEQDEAAKNPRWVPKIGSASAASVGAHVGTHAAAQAARIIFRFGLWPAALALWGIAPDDPRRDLFEQAYWQGATLIMSGYPPLAQAAIAAKAYEQGGVTGAIAHAFSRWAWAQADFQIDGETLTADIDALAIRRARASYTLLDRGSVTFPPATYNRIGTAFTSSCGTVVRIEINRKTGQIRIDSAYNVYECGEALVPELVMCQAEGGVAMGIGYALLEKLPAFEGGPGNGEWNLGDYTVARASDLPLYRLQTELLAPISPKEPPKGMAEVVMIPVVPALLNAIHDATGHRFYTLPVTPDMIKEILQ